MNLQQNHNALPIQKNCRWVFQSVKTEETFSSQDQKLVETTNLWRQLFRKKKPPQRKFASATTTNPAKLMNRKTMNIKMT